MGFYWVTGGILLAYLVVVWLLSARLPLHSSERWILLGGLVLIGLLAAGTVLWFRRRGRAKIRQTVRVSAVDCAQWCGKGIFAGRRSDLPQWTYRCPVGFDRDL